MRRRKSLTAEQCSLSALKTFKNYLSPVSPNVQLGILRNNQIGALLSPVPDRPRAWVEVTPQVRVCVGGGDYGGTLVHRSNGIQECWGIMEPEPYCSRP